MARSKQTIRQCISVHFGQGQILVRRRLIGNRSAKALTFAFAILFTTGSLSRIHNSALPTTIPDPSDTTQCKVFVPTKEELADKVIVVDDEFYGRVGNRIAAYKEVFRQALISGCHVKIRRDALSGWDSGWSLWRNTAAVDNPLGENKSQCMQKTHEYWYFHRLTRIKNITHHSLKTFSDYHTKQCAMTHGIHTAIMKGTDTYADCVADNSMMQYFGANFTHIFGHRCPLESYGALHVRGGDTTQGGYLQDGSYRSMTKENNYGPHPTSFYTSTIHMMIQRWQKVIVICEDFSNPSCDTLQSISSVVPKLQVFVARDIMHDLFTLNCAKEVAIARGSFQHAVLLRQYDRHVHEFRTQPFDSIQECNSLLPGLTGTFHYIKDAELAALYCKNIQSDAWNNSALHRQFVDRNYEMEHIACRSR